MRNSTSIDRLHELLECDPQAGRLTWKQSKGRQARGSQAGCLHKALGYVCITIDGVSFGAHRIVWAMAHDRWPKDVIDHINGDRSDNRLANLRDVSVQVNTQNRSKARSCNASGYLGVSCIRSTGRFSSSIKGPDGRVRHLGTYASAEEAHSAYMREKLVLHEGVGAHVVNRTAETTCLEEMKARMSA